MSLGPVIRKAKAGKLRGRKSLHHKIFAASSSWGATALYKGDENFAVAANSTEATGGERSIQGMDPNKHYKITWMYAVLSAAPGTGKTATITLRINGSDSTDGVITIATTATTGGTTLQDVVTYSAYVTVKVSATAGTAASTLKLYMLVEEV